MFPPVNEQMDLIRRNTVDLISEEEFEFKINSSLKKKKPLKIKLGADPSRPDLHLGHAVVLNKMKDFQDLGHDITIIVGDFTAMIGDPSGKNKTRPSLSLEETREHGRSYFEQAGAILDLEKSIILYNSEWLGKMSFRDVIQMASKYTVARMLERDDFTNRFQGGVAIAVHEFLYPLAQAMDSVHLESDVEIGGTDQLFNLLVGRDLQKEYGQVPQCVLTLPLLVGTDGKEKMSKSLDNYISFSEKPAEIYGKTLSIPDDLIPNYFKLCTKQSQDRLETIEKELAKGKANPRDLKRELARSIVGIYYGEQAAIEAEKAFDDLFIKKQIPDDIPEFILPAEGIALFQLLTKAGLCASNGESKRLINGGGVKIDGEKQQDPNYRLGTGKDSVLQAGKRRFLKLITPK